MLQERVIPSPEFITLLIGANDCGEMRARSGHFTFAKKVRFADLEPVYRELFTLFLEESGQTRDDPEFMEIILEENLRDLRKDRKPEGFNREGTIRLIFPISDGVEFYIYSRSKGLEVPRVAEALSQFLRKKRLKHELTWDNLLLFAEAK